MLDSDNQRADDLPARAPLPDGEKFFDPWEEEFRKTYPKDDKDFDF